MDIKIEPDDELCSNYQLRNSYDRNVSESFRNQGYPIEHKYRDRVKQERFEEDDTQFVLESVKSERWENDGDDASNVAFTVKIEEIDIGECSYRQKTIHEGIDKFKTVSGASLCVKKEIPVQDVAVILVEKLVHYEQNFVCHICYSIFASLNALQEHKRLHNECIINIEYEITDQEIPIEFNNTQNVKPDLKECKTPSDGKLFKCKQCDYSTVFGFSLKTHTMIHTGEKPFKCDQCDYKSTKSSDVKRHKLKHTNEKPYKCDKCDFKTAYSSYLKTHQITHCGEKPLTKDVPISVSTKPKKNIVNFDDKPFKCGLCHFKSVRSSDLKRHNMFHTGEKPFMCDICEYKTAYLTHLKKHKMSHYGEKPWKCDLCESTFTHASNLKTHKMIHSGEKPFKCDQCGFRSVRSTDLKRHKLSHSHEKPYHCDMCGYKTAYCTDLKKHKLTHFKSASQ